MLNNCLICPTHTYLCVAFCSNENCKVKLACSKCILFSHSSCQHYLIFFEDVEKGNTAELLLNENFAKVFKEEEANNILLGENTTFKQMVEEFTSEFIDKAEQLATEIKENLLDEFADLKLPSNAEKKLNKIIEIEKMKTIIQTGSFVDAKDALPSLQIISDPNTIKNQLINYKKSVNDVLDKLSLIERIRNKLDACLNEAKSFISYKIANPSLCLFDPKRTSQGLELSSEMNYVIKISQDNNPKAALLSLEIKPGSGKYIWKFKLNNMDTSLNHPTDLVGLGLIQKGYWETDLNYFNYTQFNCFATNSIAYGCLNLDSYSTASFEGAEIEFTYNSKKGNLSVKCSNGLTLSGVIDSSFTYRPFVVANLTGSMVSIIE